MTGRPVSEPLEVRNPSAEPYYLPMDCPVCGRRRMEWDGKVLRCEKCTTSSEWDGFTTERYEASVAAQERVAALEGALRAYLEDPHITGLNGHRSGFCEHCAAQYLAGNVALALPAEPLDPEPKP